MNYDHCIDWAKLFDRIFCVFFLPNKSRMHRLTEELKRVGIINSPNFEWRFTTPTHYDKIIQESYPDKKWISNIGCVNGALEQLRIFKESSLLGYKRILIIEDDIAFLKDLRELETILANIPDGFDVVQLDKGFGDKSKVKEWDEVKSNLINPYFVDVGSHCFGFSTANIYSANGIEKAIRKLENKPIAVDQINRDGGFRWSTAVDNACVQVFFKGSNFNNNVGVHFVYTCMNIDYNRYQLPLGYDSSSLYEASDRKESMGKREVEKPTIAHKNRWDMFDYVGVVCYTGYKDRIEELLPELERVGLKDKVHLHWDIPSVFKDKMSQAVGKTKFCSRPGCFNMTVGHYTILKTAYELGCRNVLVMEDDMRFLKELNSIDILLESIPMDYDHLMLDRNRLTTTDLREFTHVTEEQRRNKWIAFKESGSTGCYAMSRRGMKHYIELIEEDVKIGNVHNPDHYFRDSFQGRIYWDNTYKRYFCYPNLAVQSIAGRHGSFSSLADYWKNLSPAGINPKDYNLDTYVVTPENFFDLLEENIGKRNEEVGNEIGFCAENADLIKTVKHNCSTEPNKGVRYGESYIWSPVFNSKNVSALQIAIRDKAQLVMCEPGLIYKGLDGKLYSFVEDRKGFFSESSRITYLEEMINDISIIISGEQRAFARRMIERIVSNKITMYNDQPMKALKLGRTGKAKVLVVESALLEKGSSHRKAEGAIFEEMLSAAIKETPEADFIIKTNTHTDSAKKICSTSFKNVENIYFVDYPINPYEVIGKCDKVYVGESLLGFEALLAGKEVHTFGMPFYAGWGLTIDNQHLDRRTNMRTIEELFYIYCIMYTHWVDPDKGCGTTLDAVIDKMIRLRDQYKSAKILERTPCAEDGFGYRYPSNNFRASGLTTPSGSTRAHICVLPRIKG